LAFSPDGNIVAAGDWYGNIYLWNTKTHSRLAILSSHSGDLVWSAVFAHDGSFLVAADGDSMSVWRVARTS
jgi:WD40 repeat protein